MNSIDEKISYLLKYIKNIYVFEFLDDFILLDIPTGNIFEVDNIIYDIISQKFDIKKLLNTYSLSIITEAINELFSLSKKKLIFNEDIKFSVLNRKSVLKSLCLHVAHICDLNCRYCFASDNDLSGYLNVKNKNLIMDIETGKNAIDFLVSESKGRINLEVDFFGGEPLLNFDVIKEIIKYARVKEKIYNKKFNFVITTNAYSLKDYHNEFLNKEKVSIIYSLDGNKKTNDLMRIDKKGNSTFERVLNNILNSIKSRNFISEFPYFYWYIRGTYTHYTLNFSDSAKFFYNKGFKYISLEPVVEKNKVNFAIKESDLPYIYKEYEKLAKFYVNIKKKDKNFHFFHFELSDKPICVAKRVYGCGAAVEYMAVSPDGSLYPCHRFVENEKFLIGNVNNKNAIIENNDIIEKFSNLHLFNRKDCKNCWARYYCSGGCLANNYSIEGSLEKNYKIGCEIQKMRIKAALWSKVKLSK